MSIVARIKWHTKLLRSASVGKVKIPTHIWLQRLKNFSFNFGKCWQILSCNCCDVHPTYWLLQWHEKLNTASKAGNTFFLVAEKSGQNVKIACSSTAKKHFSTLTLLLDSYPIEGIPNQGK